MSLLKIGGSILKIIEITDRSPELISQLVAIWESAVRATHHFLTESAIQNFKTSLPSILTEVPHLVIVEDNNQPLAFLGTADQEIEMLFVDSANRGQGLGKVLINYGIENLHVTELTVNEQNPQAVGFYEHMGFETYKRTPTDDLNNPYPILYMRLK